MLGLILVLVLAAVGPARAVTCQVNNDCLPPFVCLPAEGGQGYCGCAVGTFSWTKGGITRCRQCAPGCACPGGTAMCYGCLGGFFSAAAGAAACTPCPPGTTTDVIANVGCDPQDYSGVCANYLGPVGYTACRPQTTSTPQPPPPAPQNVPPIGPPIEVDLIPGPNPPPPQYLQAGGPDPFLGPAPPGYVPSGPPFIPNVVPPYYWAQLNPYAAPEPPVPSVQQSIY
jgi:hypothetical protein